MTRYLLTTIAAAAMLLLASAARADEPIKLCATNPTSERMNHYQPECTNEPDLAWGAFDMVELTDAGPELVSVGPWATSGPDSGCSWDDEPIVVARCLLAPRRERAFSYLWTLSRYCDPAGPGANGDLAKVAAYCRPVQRIYDAMLILTERPTDPALALPGVVERGVAFVARIEPRHQFGSGVVASLTRGALSLDYNRWATPWTVGRHYADPLFCRGNVCDRDSYGTDQVRRLDELLRKPLAVDELSYDAAGDCYYAELCAAVEQ